MKLQIGEVAKSCNILQNHLESLGGFMCFQRDEVTR